jgi:hypothetical protein
MTLQKMCAMADGAASWSVSLNVDPVDCGNNREIARNFDDDAGRREAILLIDHDMGSLLKAKAVDYPPPASPLGNSMQLPSDRGICCERLLPNLPNN